jgi:hypothetical protein
VSRRRRRRNALGALGAVEGEKVEYFVPASIFNQMASNAKSTIAFCIRDVEQLLPYLEQRARLEAAKAKRLEFQSTAFTDPLGPYASALGPGKGGYLESVLESRGKTKARSAKTKEKASSILMDTVAEIRKDVAAIRKSGVAGPIPVCVYRTSGKYGDKALKTAEARANRHHERFHADSRRVEYREGQPHYGCDANIASVLGGALDPALTAFSRTYWSSSGRASNEEILARVEETMEACSGSGEDCNDVMARINDWFVAKRKPELAASFVQATAAVKAKFKKPINAMTAACRLR